MCPFDVPSPGTVLEAPSYFRADDIDVAGIIHCVIITVQDSPKPCPTFRFNVFKRERDGGWAKMDTEWYFSSSFKILGGHRAFLIELSTKFLI